MRYSEFDRVVGAIASIDVGVIPIEASRSGMEVPDTVGGFRDPAVDIP